MAAKTSGEIEKEFIKGLGPSTGKDLKAWLSELDAHGSKKRNDIINRLKTESGFGHMNASLLSGIYLNGGKPVYADPKELLENQFAQADAMRRLFEKLVGFITENFPGVTILPKKTYVSVLDKREFAAVNIRPGELRLGLDLGDQPFDELVTKSKLTGPMPRISHQIVITDGNPLNAETVKLLRESFARSN